jgi:MFS family permease
MTAKRRAFSGLTRDTWLLSFASLFADISTEMLYPVLPTFLTQNLHAGGTIVGLVEGIAQGAQNVIQGVSGTLSDRMGRRKPIALAGYAVAALAKPLIGLAGAWPVALGGRLLDRLGAGTRSAPRDALVAASADEADRGKAFGLEGAGDNAGAFLGPLIALALLGFWAIPLRWIFYLSIVPGLIAFLLVLPVRERPIAFAAKARIDVGVDLMPGLYRRYLTATALFGLGNSSNAFLILQTQALGASLQATILIYAGFNLVAALVSYPAGALSDRLGRRNLLLLSFAIFLATYLGFALATNLVLIGSLFVLYGAYQGIFRAAGKALASDLVPASLRAGGIGWYNATIGVTGLVASMAAGLLWDRVGHAALFLLGAGFALVGGVALVLLIPNSRPPARFGSGG